MRATERTARKAHYCEFCEGRIEPGTRYIDGFWISEGEPTSWRAHVDCQALADIAARLCDDGAPLFTEWPDYFERGDLPEDAWAERDRLMERATAIRARAKEE